MPEKMGFNYPDYLLVTSHSYGKSPTESALIYFELHLVFSTANFKKFIEVSLEKPPQPSQKTPGFGFIACADTWRLGCHVSGWVVCRGQEGNPQWVTDEIMLIIYGLSIDYLWIIYGISMDNLWIIR